ncbi:hypothetical protein NEIFL0001_1780 [Neisseria flavescens SK114]|nr:hypothetical protein NEIFL0001_1780 [Neisseria flavescens SK114]
MSVCPYRPSENVKSDKFLCKKAQKHRKLRYQQKQIAC